MGPFSGRPHLCLPTFTAVGPGNMAAIRIRYTPAMEQEPTTRDVMNAIVDLHGAMLHGFAQIDARLSGHDAQFVSVDGRFKQIDRRFEQIDGRFDRIERRLTSIEGEVGGLRRWRADIESRLP